MRLAIPVAACVLVACGDDPCKYVSTYGVKLEDFAAWKASGGTSCARSDAASVGPIPVTCPPADAARPFIIACTVHDNPMPTVKPATDSPQGGTCIYAATSERCP